VGASLSLHSSFGRRLIGYARCILDSVREGAGWMLPVALIALQEGNCGKHEPEWQLKIRFGYQSLVRVNSPTG
jgi:hypothetical protein